MTDITIPPPRFALDPSDRISPTWGKLSRYLNARLEQHRLQLEGDKTDTQTAKLRGQIAEVRALLRLAETARVDEFSAAPD